MEDGYSSRTTPTRFARIRYWLYRKLIRPIFSFYGKVSYQIRVRTTHRYDLVKTGLPKGWCRTNDRILHANMAILCDYVEVDRADHQHGVEVVLGERSELSRQWRFFLANFTGPIRDPESGIKFLEWEAELGGVALNQAEIAKEVLKIYRWWKKEYPSYKDLYKMKPPWTEDMDPNQRDELSADWYNQVDLLTQKHQKRTNEMLERFIKVGQYLY